MRRHACLALALVSAALALACGSSTTENVGTSSEAIITCPAGEHVYCDMNELTGKLFCSCIKNTCSYATPAPPPHDDPAWIAAWASPSVGGTCPVITTATGRWAEIGVALGPTDSNYSRWVPDDSSSVPLYPSDCTQVPGMGSSCCTYVWWPNGYPSADGGVLPMQDSADLCPVDGATLVPLEQVLCTRADGECPQPGGGGCSTCKPVQGP